MELSAEEKQAIKDAMNGKLSDDYNELEKLLENLSTEKEATTNHGTFKRLDTAMSKVRSKMSKIQA